ncbi:MAG: RNA polymerase sigma factor [Saprospiraceae bacterium]|jgi:RNA polymerase sigma factor (sigma-70 family)|nr:RNA polymerase sigma factor [Saprospiraceae bacterium]
MIKFSNYSSDQRDAFVCQIFGLYHTTLYAYAVSACKRSGIDVAFADDFMQELYCRIISDPRTVMEGCANKGIGYLCTMLRNLVTDAHRKNKSIQRLKEVVALQVPTLNVNAWSEQTHIDAFLEAAEKILPVAEFDAIRLYIEGYKLQEIAEIMQTNTTQVHRLVKRAREKISLHLFDRN